MGIGVVDGGRLKIVVVARAELTPPEWAQWRRAISKASELLFDATQGQLQIGDVYFADDGNGEDTADVILYPSGDPSFSSGRFGNSGAAVHIMPYVKEQVLTFLHEFGHHLWGLGEEYSQTPTSHQIDTSSPAPDRRTIPTLASGLADDQLVDEAAKALLTIAGQIERHAVTANTSTSITVDADFSVLPTDADSTTVWIQRPAECATAPNANFCIMENSRGAAGPPLTKWHVDTCDRPGHRVLHRFEPRPRRRDQSRGPQQRLVLGDHRHRAWLHRAHRT